MIVGNKLRVLVWISLAFLLAPSSDLLARTRKGDKFLKLARAAESRKDFDAALAYYNQAMTQDPADAAYELGMRRVRFQAGALHVHTGQLLRDSGKLDEALVEFQKAFGTDPSSPIALQEIKRTMEMLERNKAGALPASQAILTPADLERQKTQDRIDSLSTVPQLKPITSQISTLKMNNQPPKVLYETVGKLAGINVVFDPQFTFSGKNVNLDLTNATLEEALDYIGMQTKTFWKPISSNTIFVAEDNVTKRRDYEDQVVKVFYLKNVTSVQEFQEIVTAVRSVTDIRRMFTYAAQNAVMCRGTVDQIGLAEKLFHDLDKPKSEVVVDVIVMEANRDKTRDYAAGLVSGGKTGLVIPVGFTPKGVGTTTTPVTPSPAGTPAPTPTGGSSSGSSSISVSQIGKVSFSDFSLSLPGALLQAVMTDNQTRVLQSPQVRASDGQKVSLRIGDKVPYATGSFQTGIGGVGTGGGFSPLASTQFQFAEVGVTVDMTPHVHGSDEVTLHVLIEISNVSRTVTISGVDQPVISQRKNEAEIRLRDGEVSLLGGLMQGQDSNSVSGIPGLVNVPILGKLVFGSSSKNVSHGELLIALIPHIIRSPSITPVDMRGVSAGTDQVVKLSYQQAHPEVAPTGPASVPPPGPAAPKTAPVPVPTPATPPGPPVLTFSPTSVQSALSGPVVITLQAQNVTDLSVAPFHVKWDPKLLRLNQVIPGALIGDGGPQTNPPSVDIRNDSGEATISISRITGAPGVNGSGELAKLMFMAVGKGTGTVAVTDAGLRNSKQEPIAAAGPTMPVTIQ